jgi:uncharacterized protein YeaC (DUF1315 family)
MAVDRQVEIEDLLSSIDEILEQAKAVPFSDKVMVERAEILEITKEIRLRLPTEIEQSKWVLEEKNRILADAQKEADAKIAAAEEERSNMVNEHEVTKRAYAQAEEIVEASKKVARDMKIGAKEYADDLLQQVDEQMKRMSDFTVGSIENILKDYQANVQNFNAAMDQKRQILQQNRKELNVNRSN